jgi:hypothetical protein
MPGRVAVILAPLFLDEEQAAAFLGVGSTLFRAEVEAGIWPPAVRRGARGRRLTWYRPALEEAAARLATGRFPVARDVAPPQDARPPAAGIPPEAAKAAIGRIKDAARRVRA